MSFAGISSDELHTRRMALGLSQAGLARALGLAPNTVARWERGELPIGSPMLVRLALDHLASRRERTEAPAYDDSDSRRSLPRLTAPLIGRADEQGQLCELLSGPDVSLVTLTGPGGTGKTTLALAVASDCSAWVKNAVWADLTHVHDGALVLPMLARIFGVQEAPGASLADMLRASLMDEQLLLVMDNCEHVLSAAQKMAQLLVDCQGVKVLATSREPLRLAREQCFPVQPLDSGLSEDASWHDIVAAPAVTLFDRRARSVNPSFVLDEANARTVATICARLDGLPLAIELAATRAQLLSPAAILERLGHPLQFLQGGPHDAPQRHQTLRSTIDWSYALLDEPERALFRRLSVFSGGASLAAIEAICDEDGIAADQVLDLLGSLLSKSLVRAIPSTGSVDTRYDLLETLREYGLERLDAAGEADLIRARHFSWYLQVAAEIEPELWGRDQESWFAWLQVEHDNLRAALEWSQRQAATESLRLASSLGRFWYVRGYLAEGAAWLSAALRGAREPSAVRARALGTAGVIAYLRGAASELRSLADEALPLARSHSDQFALGQALLAAAIANHVEGDPRAAEPFAEESVAVWSGHGFDLAAEYARYTLAEITWYLGEPAKAVALMQQALEVAVRVHDPFASGIIRARLGHLMLDSQTEQAIELLQENLAARWSRMDRFGIAESLCGLAWAAARRGAAELATILLGAADNLWRVTGGTFPHQYAEEHSRAQSTACGTLGDEMYARTLEEGRAMRLDNAVSLALAPIPSASQNTVVTGAPTQAVLLSPRERAVAVLIARGMTNRRIATTLVISERTAESHVEHIRKKLNCSSRAEIAVWAQTVGLLDE